MYHNPGSSFLLICKVPEVLSCGLFDRKHKQLQLNGFFMIVLQCLGHQRKASCQPYYYIMNRNSPQTPRSFMAGS